METNFAHKRLPLLLIFLTISLFTYSQDKVGFLPKYSVAKYGTVLGIQRGKFFNVELGIEQRRKQLKLKSPNTWALNGILEYAWETNTMGLKFGSWYKTGRTGLTYGGNLVGASNFDRFKVGIAPSIGFSIRGIHAAASYNVFLNKVDEIKYNNLHLSIRLFISRDSKIIKKESERSKERAKQKKKNGK